MLTHLRQFGLAMALVLASHPAQAHEFWIEPVSYQVDVEDDVVADLRLGDTFSGARFPYNPRQFSRFDFALGDRVAPVPGRAGDRPAAGFSAPGQGLVILAHETNPLRLTYRSMDKFERFLAQKDWSVLAGVHRSRGLPDERFVERYTRHVKSLIAVGSGAGADRALGLQTELVALSNPYTEPSDTLAVQLFLEGAPRADAQVTLFEKTPDGTVRTTLHRTDLQGVAVLPVQSGHAYLADAVVIRALEPSVTDPAVWESLWAGLTFAVP